MTQQASFTLKKQIQSRGYYAGIDCELLMAEESVKNEIYIELDDNGLPNDWKSAIKSGVNIFLNIIDKHYPSQSKKYTIKMTNLKWMPVDSNYILMVYATIKSLAILFEYSIDDYAFFDEETGEVYLAGSMNSLGHLFDLPIESHWELRFFA